MPRTYRTPFKNRKCTYVDCGRKHFAKGYCTKHYARFKKYGHAAIAGTKSGGSLFGICLVASCGNKSLAKGLCNAHWLNLQRHGSAVVPRRRIKGTPGITVCIVDGCGDAVKSRDYCSLHYSRVIRFGEPEPQGIRRKLYARIPEGATCEWDGCGEPVDGLGLCASHYAKQHRAKNSMRYKVYGLQRRARVDQAFVCDYSPEQVSSRMKYWGDKCWMCGGPFEHIDHVKPLAKGGKDCPSNMRPACRSCNSGKCAKWYGVRNLSRFIKV